MKSVHIACVVAPLIAACAGIPKPTLVTPPAPQHGAALAQPRLDDSIKDSLDQRDTQSLIDETYSIIQSREFAQNFAKLDGDLRELWLSPYGETIPAEQVILAYLGIDENYRPVRATLKWGKTEQTGPSENNSVEAVIELGQAKLAQWRSSSLLHKSCAINTLAHELTHTVSRDSRTYVYLFTDGGRRWATFLGRPLVSYTVGAVAQCTYLQKHGDQQGKDLRACIQRWGTNNFYSGGCSPTPG